jgi:hypothetical protein
MEDLCIICCERLATVTFNCGHRCYCKLCFEVILTRTNGRAICPYDKRVVETVQDTTAVQLRELTLEDHLPMYDVLRVEYPFGYKLFSNRELPADETLYRIVREAVNAVRAHVISLDDLRERLLSRLTMAQYQLVFVELLKHDDLHGVMEQLDRKKTENLKTTKFVKELIVSTVEKTDPTAIGMRALVGTAGGTGFSVASRGVSGLTSSLVSVGGVSSLAVFAIFSALEVYRWSKSDDGKIDGITALVNIGEHAVGTTSGFLGGWGGAIAGGLAGAALGSVVPVIGTVIGGIAGTILGLFFGGVICDATNRYIYRKFLPRKEVNTVEKEEDEFRRLTPREIAERAATKFGVNLDCHSFSEAQTRFRQELLRSHPDKNPNASLAEKEQLQANTRDNLACWCVLREYYKDHCTSSSNAVRSDGKDLDESPEGYIKIKVLRVFNAISNSWKVARCFFGTASLDRPLTEHEELQEMVLYV